MCWRRTGTILGLTAIIAALMAVVVLPAAGRTHCYFPRSYEIVYEPSTGWSVSAEDAYNSPNVRGRVTGHRFGGGRGLVATRSDRRSYSLAFDWLGEPPSPSELAALRVSAANLLNTDYYGRLPGFDPVKLAQGDYTYTRHYTTGYIVDGCAYLGIAGAGLGFCVFVRSTIRKDRLEALARAGAICPHCQYDLRGLTAPVCPECGASRARMQPRA